MASSIPTGFCSLPLPVAQLSLAVVLKCGQSFRWTSYPLTCHPGSVVVSASPTHEYRLCLRDRVVCLRQSSDTLFYRSVFPELLGPTQAALKEAETLTWLRDYFQLDVDLSKLYNEWAARDKVFASLRSRFSGIRMLRQDPWENLVSFICSSNNNISRITKMVQSLCQQYSPPLLSLPPPSDSISDIAELRAYHPFPSPSAVAGPQVSTTLRSLGFGYRAEYVQKTAQLLVDNHGSTSTPHDHREAAERWLLSLRDTDTCQARAELLKFMGVGRKVADCVLLMSLDKREVVPVDTHVHQIAVKHYGFRQAPGARSKSTMTPKLYEEVNERLVGVWGEYAGWAHLVLFTADLKSFSSYGISSPSEASQVALNSNSLALPTPPSTPTPSPPKAKRKRSVVSSSRSAIMSARAPAEELFVAAAAATLPVAKVEPDNELVSLADRVKRRRRGAACDTPSSCSIPLI